MPCIIQMFDTALPEERTHCPALLHQRILPADAECLARLLLPGAGLLDLGFSPMKETSPGGQCLSREPLRFLIKPRTAPNNKAGHCGPALLFGGEGVRLRGVYCFPLRFIFVRFLPSLSIDYIYKASKDVYCFPLESNYTAWVDAWVS